MAKVVKVYEDTYEELKRLQEEIYKTKGFRLTLGSVIDYVLKEHKKLKKQKKA